MALQAGLPLLDFSLIAGGGKKDYFAAIQAGLDRNYQWMERIFAEIIEQILVASRQRNRVSLASRAVLSGE